MDNAALTYTQELPQEPGWYWVLRLPTSDPDIVKVKQLPATPDSLVVEQVYLGGDGVYYGALAGFAAYWAGPIPPISLPK